MIYFILSLFCDNCKKCSDFFAFDVMVRYSCGDGSIVSGFLDEGATR